MTRVLALRVKTHAVIVHLQGDYSILGLQPERDSSGLGMFDGVVHRFNSDAVGFDAVFIGIETPDEDSLAECSKHQNSFSTGSFCYGRFSAARGCSLKR